MWLWLSPRPRKLYSNVTQIDLMFFATIFAASSDNEDINLFLNLTEEAFLEIFDLPPVDDPKERTRRGRTLKEHQQAVLQNNQLYLAGRRTWFEGINEFSDIPDDEFIATHTGLIEDPDQFYNETQPLLEESLMSKLPASHDSVSLGHVSPVKNQGVCGNYKSYGKVYSLGTPHSGVKDPALSLCGVWHGGQCGERPVPVHSAIPPSILTLPRIQSTGADSSPPPAGVSVLVLQPPGNRPVLQLHHGNGQVPTVRAGVGWDQLDPLLVERRQLTAVMIPNLWAAFPQECRTTELAFPDGELGAPAARSEDDTTPLPEDEMMEPVARIEDDDTTSLPDDEMMELAVARSLNRKKKKSKKHHS